MSLLTGDEGAWWDGVECVKCVFGCIPGPHPVEIYPTMEACEVAHAHCQ